MEFENHRRVWKLEPKANSVMQTTPLGKSVSEVSGRSHFTFDKVLSEDTSNFEVYNAVAKGIVSNVIDGLVALALVFPITQQEESTRTIMTIWEQW